MEHELLHDEHKYDLRLSNKGKKEKEKGDQGERKKWNFRKTNAMETSGNRSPSPTEGLINPSAEAMSKQRVSTTMIFENKFSDTDYDIPDQTELQVQSPPVRTPSPSTQQKPTSPKAQNFSFDCPSPAGTNNQQKKSLPSKSSPPLINRPPSARKLTERFHRQISEPVIGMHVSPSSNVNYQQKSLTGANEFLSQTAPFQIDRADAHRSIHVGDLLSSSQWQSHQQPAFNHSAKLSNVVEHSQNDVSHRQETAIKKDSPGGEPVGENRKMWQDNSHQELVHGKWTDFSSTSNEVFIPDDRAWAVAENAAVDADENEQQSRGDTTISSQSSYSSESGNDEDTEETVWKINEEQKAYYLNQFRILQPAEKGVVTGPKARDFFLKSGLTTDVLSKIWNLADLDNDGALNFEEFCIAMHVVVAVRHGIEVPTALPQYLIPEQYEKQVAPVTSPKKFEADNEQLPLSESPQEWARFSPDPQTLTQMVAPEDEATTVQHVVNPGHRQRTLSDPSSQDQSTTKDNSKQVTRKTSLGIPRIRGPLKQANLLDTPHWAILPPPSKFTKETPDDVGKSNLFVPTGTIIPDDNGESEEPTPRTALLKVEEIDRSSHEDIQLDSSSSETEQDKERPKSLTNENPESASSGNLSSNSSQNSVGISQDSVDGMKKNAPIPPPRKKTGHSRSSSLDLQKLFNNKGGSTSLQNTFEDSVNKDLSQHPHATQENFADFSKFENSLTTHSTDNIYRHRRSASLDSTHAIHVEPSQPPENQHAKAKDLSSSHHEWSTSLPRPVPKKKPASPPLSVRQKKDTQQDSGSDGMIEKEKKMSKEPIHFVVKPITRLEQLHSRIRDLKTKNTMLSRVNNELQQELKQMMENRIELESSLEQLKPFPN